MKVGIIIPDRNDRPGFLENCLRMIDDQIFAPFLKEIYIETLVVDFEAINNECDITTRYRKGYERFYEDDFDCILLIENDDWYCRHYINTMIVNWERHGKPDIFGTSYTYYYHLGLLKYEKLDHPRRSSAMNTLIKPDLNIKWPADNDPYTDIHLWQQLKGVTFTPERIISIGMKHNVGKTGGAYHNTVLERYNNDDKEMLFLNNIDQESMQFYKSVHEKIRNSFQ